MSTFALWTQVETARAGSKSAMMYEAPKSRYGKEPVRIVSQHETQHNGNTFEADIPAVFRFAGDGLTKNFGHGAVDLNFEDIVIFLEELPSQSIAHALNVGLNRILTTAYAGSKSPEEAGAAVIRKLGQLFSGDIGTRVNATPATKAAANPDYKIISRLFADRLLKQTEKAFGGKRPKTADKEGMKKWDQAQVDALKLLAQHATVITMVAEEKARLAAIAAIADDLFADDDDEFGLLSENEGDGEEESEEDEETADAAE